VRARPRFVALQGALFAVLVAGPLAYVTAGKSVTVDVDGASHGVRTYAGTVGDALSQQGITVGAHDTVSPATSTPVTNGLQVVVLRGHLVHLVVDGVPSDVWTTADDVQELTSSFGERYDDAYLSVSRWSRIPESGLVVDVRMPKTVSVVYGGHPTSFVTTAATWADALAGVGLPLGATADLSVPPESAPVQGQRVDVVLTGTRTVTRSVAIPFASATRTTPSLYVGSSRVISAGRPGRFAEVWRYTLRDGAIVSAVLVSRRLVANPQPRIVEVGTRHRVVHPSGYPATAVDNLNWSALASCESGGNPRAVGGGGTYFGLYQFSLGAWHGVGGTGNPIDASSSEQTYRAKLLYLKQGAGAWPYCGHVL
jgi:resuscitation-promoting factor RpfB